MIDIRKSFSSKLSITVMLLALPIFILSLGILFVQSRRMIREEAVGRANSALNTTMQRVTRNINTVETATESNYRFALEHLQPQAILALTRSIVMLNPNIDGCSISMEPGVFPEYGRYFSAYSIRERVVPEDSPNIFTASADSIVTVIEQQYDYFSKVWYKKPHDLDAPCWENYFDETDSLDVALKGMIASYGRPIHDDSGHLIAVISTDISLKRLSRTISLEKPYPHSYFIMIDGRGNYIIHPDSTRLFTQSIFDGTTLVEQPNLIALGHEMTKGNSGDSFLSIDGVPGLVTYAHVPGTPWSLALVCPDSDILHGYHQQMYILVPLLLFGLVLILLLCHHVVAHAIRPLNTLLDKTQSIAEGHMEVHIPRSQRIDAVGSLQNSFASMLQRLNFHMGSVRYTTEQAKQCYEELAEATRLAEEADRQKTAFMQNVSHQIRTPLNIIMGFAQIVSNTPTLTKEEMKDITSTMNHNSKLLKRIVQMLFDSSDTGFYQELNSNKQDKVPCNELALETIGYINLHYPGINIKLNSEVGDDFSIKTNRLYLMRSLRELLYNSAKYSDGQHVSLTIKAGKGFVYFIVEDTGKGISEADSERMFLFFTKVDDLTEGLGLGLPLAKRHILNLGGNLNIDPDYHEGCRFIVELPA